MSAPAASSNSRVPGSGGPPLPPRPQSAAGGAGAESAASANVTVCCRIRPPRDATAPQALAIDAFRAHSVRLPDPRDLRSAVSGKARTVTEGSLFGFDALYTPDTSTSAIFEERIRPVVASSLLGYNGTVLAFGQTGSGKTFTIGDVRPDPSSTASTPVGIPIGLIPLAIAELERVREELKAHATEPATVTVSANFVEIYNEDVFDLLGDTRRVRETPLAVRDFAVQGATTVDARDDP